MSDPTSARPTIKRFEYKPEWNRQWSGAAIISIVLVSVTTALLISLKVASINLQFSTSDVVYTDEQTISAGQLGALLFFTIAPIIGAIIAGHVGMTHTWGGKARGRLFSALGLGAGYLHLVLWTFRVVIAGLGSIAQGDILLFMPEFLLWA